MNLSKKQQPLYFQVVLIAGFIFIAFMLFALARSIYRDLFQVGRYIEVSQQSIEDQQAQLAEKPGELEHVESPRYQQKIAKELLGLRLPGEEVVVISNAEQRFEDLLPGFKKKNSGDELLTNPQKWWRYLFGI